MSLLHRPEQTSLLLFVRERGDGRAGRWFEVSFLAQPGVYYVLQPSHVSYLLSLSFPSLSLSWVSHFDCTCSRSYLCPFMAKDTLLWPGLQTLLLRVVNVFMPDMRKEAVGCEWSGTKVQRETKARSINFQTENGFGRAKWGKEAGWKEWVMQMGRCKGGLEGPANVRNELQNILETVTQMQRPPAGAWAAASHTCTNLNLQGFPMKLTPSTLQLDWLTLYLLGKRAIKESSQQAAKGLVELDEMNRWERNWPWDE